MRTHKTVQCEREVIDKQTCDLCGEEARFPGDWKGSGMWEVKETEISVRIRHKEGTEYPDGGSGTELHVDMCPNCFKNKLIPWLNSQGAKLRQEEWSW